MATANREAVWKSMEHYKNLLPEMKGWDILEIGIDGDEKPSGNYKYFGKGNQWKTMDNLERLEPDILADISYCPTIPSEQFNLIICSQVIEHLWDFTGAINGIYRLLKKGGYAIIDCPFEFPYHGLPDYDDYWRISYTALKKLMLNTGFGISECKQLDCLTTALGYKSNI